MGAIKCYNDMLLSRLVVKIMLSGTKQRREENKKRAHITKTLSILSILNVFDVHSHKMRGNNKDSERWFCVCVSPMPATTLHTTHVTLRNFKIHSCIKRIGAICVLGASFPLYLLLLRLFIRCCLICLLANFTLIFLFETMDSDAGPTK